jgi:hypothetical protein
VLAQTMLQIQGMIQEVFNVGAENRVVVANETSGAADGQVSHSLLFGTCTQVSANERITAQEASVALEYIDHVKELRDQAADLERECEENRHACASAKV